MSPINKGGDPLLFFAHFIDTVNDLKYLKKLQKLIYRQKLEIQMKTFLLTEKHHLLRNVSVSFPARKSKIELEIAI